MNIHPDHFRRVADALNTHLAPLFIPGVKLTLIARYPEDNDADVLVTNEAGFEELFKLLERSKARGLD